MDALLKGLATVGGATIIKGEHEEAFLGQVIEVNACASRPSVGNELGVRAAIDIDDDGIFLRSVEVVGLDESCVEGLSVVGLQRAKYGLADAIVLQRVFGLVQASDKLAVFVLQINIVGYIGAVVEVEEILAVGGGNHIVSAVFLGDLGHLAALEFHHVAVAFQRTDFGAAVVDVFAVGREAVEVGDDEIALGELLHQTLADGI